MAICSFPSSAHGIGNVVPFDLVLDKAKSASDWFHILAVMRRSEFLSQ
jgi:hypothetical protein